MKDRKQLRWNLITRPYAKVCIYKPVLKLMAAVQATLP